MLIAKTRKPRNGFTPVPNAVLDDKRLKPGPKLTLIALWSTSYADKDRAGISQLGLHRRLGFGREAIRDYLLDLADLGFIEPFGDGKPGKKENYKLIRSAWENLTENPLLNLTEIRQQTWRKSATNKKQKKYIKNKNPNAELDATSSVVDHVDSASGIPIEYDLQTATACLSPDGNPPGSKPAANPPCSKSAVNRGLIPSSPDWDMSDNLDEAQYNVDRALALVGGEYLNPGDLPRMIENHGAVYVSFWASWLPRWVAKQHATGKAVRKPAAFLCRAIENRWQVDPTWPEYDLSLGSNPISQIDLDDDGIGEIVF